MGNLTASAAEDSPVLTPAEAASYLRRSIRHLAFLRRSGDGPAFLRFGDGPGSRVLYRRSDLDIWLEDHRRGDANS
jgi:hypothetical protein